MMKTLHVTVPNHEYDILIGKNILNQAAESVKNVSNPAKIMIVTDENVNRFYGERLINSLKQIAEVKTVVLPAGETTKSLDFLKQLYDAAFDFGMTRADLMVALGGGVVGDLAGFCASTLFRGVDVIQIPTTLLAQVDSSVGGKTAIDVPQGKNLVGTFYQPKQVIIDTETLKTLPGKEFASGLAEVIKYGAIWDKALFSRLEKAEGKDVLMENIADIVFTCCDIKRQVVEKDEHDTGLRMILNFGHTAGHIVEKAYHYTGYTHGQAVAFGMIVASRLGEKMGRTAPGTAERVLKLIKKNGLPTAIDIEEQQLMGAALDKKATGSSISVILLKEIGKCEICKMPVTEFADRCKEIWK